MTELDARHGKKEHDGTTGCDSGSGRVAGAGRRTEEGGPPGRAAGEQAQHPKRIDGSEDPASGDAALENHESGVWNQERDAEEGSGNGLDDRDEKV